MFKVSKNIGSVPEGQLVYAIGDIHGRADLLLSLMEKLVIDSESSDGIHKKTMIFLGDYIDRGTDTKKTIDIMLNDLPDEFEIIPLKGNHEEMMLEAMKQKEALPTWIHNGGQATLHSYGIDPDNYMMRDDATLLLGTLLAAKMPADHKTFFSNLEITKQIGDYFFVHAGVNPDLPLSNQRERDLLWIRRRFLQYSGKFEKVIVHGHTPAEEPEVLPFRIGIDTGAWTTGRLTALKLVGKTHSFIST